MMEDELARMMLALVALDKLALAIMVSFGLGATLLTLVVFCGVTSDVIIGHVERRLYTNWREEISREDVT